MYYRHFVSYSALLLVFVLALAGTVCLPLCSIAQGTAKKTYTITGDVHVWLEGKTNVAGYQCHCRDKLPLRPVAVTALASAGRRGTGIQTESVQIGVRKLDCGNPAMNSDMYKALRAETHPWVSLEILQVREPEAWRQQQGIGQWLVTEADIQLRINGMARTHTLNVRSCRDSESQFHFITSLPISMYDFGVTPPRPMMGLITVSDKIVVHVDAIVRVTPGK